MSLRIHPSSDRSSACRRSVVRSFKSSSEDGGGRVQCLIERAEDVAQLADGKILQVLGDIVWRMT
jgi:hypothetical protein